MTDSQINNPETKVVTVWDKDRCNGVWPGTTEMVDAAIMAERVAHEMRMGHRETIMYMWNSMVKAHP